MIKNFQDWLFEALDSHHADRAENIFLSAKGNLRYNEIFNGQDRLYYDFKSKKAIKSLVLNDVVSELEKNGYTLIDYIAATCYKTSEPKRVLKVQRTLFRLDKENLARRMDNDPIRDSSKTKGMKVVISRHGIDIAGQSTGRSWSSCKEIDCGENERYVWSEIKAGALVAYLIKEEDLDIEDPIARQTIGVYRMKGKRSVALFPTSNVYGNYRDESFPEFVMDWCVEANKKINSLPGEYFSSPRCASDLPSQKLRVDDNLTIKDYIEHKLSDNAWRRERKKDEGQKRNPREEPGKRGKIINRLVNSGYIMMLKDPGKMDEFFIEVSKLSPADSNYFLENTGIKSEVIAKLLNDGDIKEITAMWSKNEKTLSKLLSECVNDWDVITEKRMIELYEIFEKDIGKEDIEELFQFSNSTITRFLKKAYTKKYKK